MSLPSCITLRTVKGSVLSWAELDNNFICLNNSIENLSNSLLKNGNMWHIPSGYTLTLESDYQHFIYGDMVVEGLIQLSGDSQLVVLNGDLIFSGGSVVGTGTVYNIQLPNFDTKVTGLTYSGDVLTIYQNDGTSYSATVVTSTDVTITGGTYDPVTGVATFYNNVGGNFPVTGFLTGYTDVQVNYLDYNGNTLVLTQTNGTSFSANTPMFSGNTSGDCITDLYVKNLNSCSPLRIQNVSNGNVLIGENGGVNVGIGTSTPTAKLSLSGSVSLSDSFLDVKNNLYPSIGTKIDGLGNITIEGPSNAGYSQLLVKNSTGNQSDITIDSNNIGSSLNLKRTNQDRYSIVTNNTNSVDETLYVPFRTFLDSSHRILTRTGTTEIMYLDATVGNSKVGIGTTSPTAKLHIQGSDSSSSNYGLKVQNSGGTDNFVVRNDGNVGIGTSTPSSKLHVVGPNSSSPTALFESNATNNTSYTVRAIATTTNTQSNVGLYSYVSGGYANLGLWVEEGLSCFGPFNSDSKVYIKGIDSSSSNYGLKVQNSGGTNTLQVRNDGYVTGNGNEVTGKNNFTLGHSNNIIGGAGLTVGRDDFNSVLSIYGANYPTLRFYANAYSSNIDLQSAAGGQNLTLTNNSQSNYSWLSPTNIGINFPATAYTIDSTLKVMGSDSSTGFGLKVQNSGGTDNLVVRNDGNVGIGTSTPTTKLEISGDTKLSSLSNVFKISSYTALGMSQGVGAANVFIGGGVVTDGTNGGGISIGPSSTSFGDGVSIGQTAKADSSAGDSIAIGRNSTANGTVRSVAIGRNATSSASNAWALGYNATANQDNTFIFGDSSDINIKSGFGTNTPEARIHIKGSDSSSSNYGLKIQNSGGTNNFVVRNDGNVGIGTSTPTSKLQIKDETNSGIPRLQINTHTGNGGANNKGLYVTGNIDSSSDILCLLEHTNFAGGGGNGKIFKATGGNGGNKTTFDIEDKGYVRIGDTGITSNSAVHVKWTPNSFVPNSNIGNQDTFGLNIEHLYEVSGQSSNKYGLKIDSTGYYQPANTSYKNYGIFVNTDTGVGTGTTYAAVFNGGNVGIGTSAPTEKLEVDGKIKTSTLQVSSGSTDGYVLTSIDTLGNTTWKPKVYSTGNIIEERWTISNFAGTVLTNGTSTPTNRGGWILDLGDTSKWSKSGCTGPVITYRVVSYNSGGATGSTCDLFNRTTSSQISGSEITINSTSTTNIQSVTINQSNFPSTPSLVIVRHSNGGLGTNNLLLAEIVATWTVI